MLSTSKNYLLGGGLDEGRHPDGLRMQYVNHEHFSLLKGTYYSGEIQINYDNPDLDNTTSYDNALVEEIFHAGQSRYYEKINPELANRTVLQDEVEAKIFKAYENFLGTEIANGAVKPEDDDIINWLEANPGVEAYFNAVRNNDSEGIKQNEAAFRAAAIQLADDISSIGGNYSQWSHNLSEYEKTGGATPFFDYLTKDVK
jgi:hypothetical protein